MEIKNMEMPQPIEEIKVNDSRCGAVAFASGRDWIIGEKTQKCTDQLDDFFAVISTMPSCYMSKEMRAHKLEKT